MSGVVLECEPDDLLEGTELVDEPTPIVTTGSVTKPLFPEPPADIHSINGTKDVIAAVEYEDMARRVLHGDRNQEIAAALNLSTQAVARRMRDPRFIAILVRAKDELYQNIDNTMRNERIAPILRQNAQAIRAQTLQAEILTMLGEKVADRTIGAKQTDTAVKLAFGILDRADVGVSEKRDRSDVGAGVNVNINLTARQVDAAREGLNAADLNLSHITDGFDSQMMTGDDAIDVEPIPTSVLDAD